MNQFNIEHLIPSMLMNDKNCRALAMAIQAGVRKMNTITDAAKKALSDIDSMTDDRLDDLLWEMNMTPQTDISRQVKRELIRNAVRLSRTAGTAKSIMEYTDLRMPGTWAGQYPVASGSPQGLIIFTDEGMSTSREQPLKNDVQRYIPITEMMHIVEGQTIGLGCHAWVEIGGRKMNENAYICDALRQFVSSRLKTKFKPSNVHLVFTVDGTNEELTPLTNTTLNNELLIQYTTENKNKFFTQVLLKDSADQVIVTRQVKNTKIMDDVYYLKVFTHYNDEPDPDASFDMSDKDVTWIVDTMNSSTQLNNLRAVVNYESAQSVTVTGCTLETEHTGGWYISRYTFKLNTPLLDKRISNVSMGLSNGSYIVGEPDSVTNSLYPVNKKDLTFCIAVKYDGDPNYLVGKFKVGVSFLQ